MDEAGRGAFGAHAGADAPARGRWSANLRTDVVALTEFADRSAGGPGHLAARRHLSTRAAELGLWPYHGPEFVAADAGGVHNVLALVPGADRHRRPIVVAANYDTPPAARGAGKNAAAAAAVLAAAQPLLAAGLERGVLLAFLDGGGRDGGATARSADRRDGARGARTLLEHQRHHDIKAAVVLDRVGHRVEGPLEGALAVTGVETDARLQSLLTSLDGGPLRLVPVHRRYRSDPMLSAAFHAAEVPYLELCGGSWPGHDGADDTADTLDYALLGQVVELVVTLVRRLDTVRLPGPYEGADTLEFELGALERHFRSARAKDGGGRGPVDGATRPRGRSAIDRAVAPLLRSLGD